jgi:hypothetical protein
MSTVQEIFEGSTTLYNKKNPCLVRLTQLTWTDQSEACLTDVTLGLESGYCVRHNISASWFGTNKAIVAAYTHRMLLTYNLDKKLIVITDVGVLNSTNETVYAPNIILIKSTTGCIWNDASIKYMNIDDIANNCGTIFSCLNMQDIRTIITTNARKDSGGFISLQSNFTWKYPAQSASVSVPQGTVYRLSGNGVYLADGDLSDMCSDYGKIIADGNGKSYICCGRRLWMDYD